MTARTKRKQLREATRAVGRRRLRERARRLEAGETTVPERALLRGRIAELAAEEEVATVVPDLLHRQPTLSVNGAEIRAALDFAFAGGGCEETLSSVMVGTRLSSSDWDASAFAEELFVGELVEQCFEVEIDGWTAAIDTDFLVCLLSQPPADGAEVELRHSVLRELAGDDELRQRFADLYRLLCRLRGRLKEAAINSVDATERRIEVLTIIRDLIRCMASDFGDCASSLGRIDEFARAVEESEAYRSLVELLDYEGHLATVDVRLRLGADGRLRGFNIIRGEENESNRFWASPLGRWLIKLRLWWRAYRISEKELVERWLQTVFDEISPNLPPFFQLLAHMELYLAALSFRDTCRARKLDVCLPELIDAAADDTAQDSCHLRDLFNPLLFSQKITPKTCDVVLDLPGDPSTTTIITGPNSGGKTRLLQAIGLSQAMAQAGIYVPAREARIRRVPGVFVSLIDAPSAGQAEGRLGTELIRIRTLFERARRGSLVLLDELCSGTNPSEGEEIFVMVLELLGELQPNAFISSHFLTLAGRLAAGDEPNLSFLQVELADGQSTYRFIEGVAESSLATQTAARLGVTRAELLELIRKNS